jgi:hypothetical protein
MKRFLFFLPTRHSFRAVTPSSPPSVGRAISSQVNRRRATRMAETELGDEADFQLNRFKVYGLLFGARAVDHAGDADQKKGDAAQAAKRAQLSALTEQQKQATGGKRPTERLKKPTAPPPSPAAASPATGAVRIIIFLHQHGNVLCFVIQRPDQRTLTHTHSQRSLSLSLSCTLMPAPLFVNLLITLLSAPLRAPVRSLSNSSCDSPSPHFSGSSLPCCASQPHV